MANSVGAYYTQYARKLQERLAHPTTWKALTNVMVDNFRVDALPRISVMPSIQTGTRGTASVTQDFTTTSTDLTISTYRELMVYIDRADEAQVTYPLRMELAKRQGQLINEVIESLWLADHANWTDFTNASIGGAAGNITVSASNIDDIARGIRREIREANGQSLMAEKGVAIAWRPADFELVEQFAQANGFNLADLALKDGAIEGFKLFGVEHYFTNDFTAGHVFAGVKGICDIGLLRETWGQLDVIVNPAGASGGNLSGTGLRVRSDSGLRVPAEHSGIVFDVTVA